MDTPDTTGLTVHELLDHLLGCGSRDEMRTAITSWIGAHPRPRTETEIYAQVDEILEPWYAVHGDPRPRAARREELVAIVERAIDEARRPLGARAWLFEWLATPNPQLDQQCPDELLGTPEGLEELKSLLLQT
jgi:hypothetical protein